MTKEQVIELANRAGVMPCYIGDSTAIERFAKLVRNAALEEAAEVCRDVQDRDWIINLKEPTP